MTSTPLHHREVPGEVALARNQWEAAETQEGVARMMERKCDRLMNNFLQVTSGRFHTH